MSRMAGLFVLLLTVMGCQQEPPFIETTPPLPTVTTDLPDRDTTTTTSTTTDSGDNGCFGEDLPLAGDGFLGRFDSQNSDSQAIAGFNWSETGDCAAVTVGFRSGAGAPAVDPPAFRAEYLRHTAVVRLELAEAVTESAVSEQALDTGLLDAAYVALDPAAAGLIIDVHLAAGADVRVRPASSPARIIVEIEADGGPVAGSATTGEAVVVFAPATSMPPLVVQGYGRAGIEISASFVSSTRVLEDTLSLAASPTRWTTFEWPIRDFQPGPVSIRIGDAEPIEFVSR